MQLLVLLVVCWVAVATKATQSEEQATRYTLLAESKKQEQQPGELHAAELQPWRRLAYTGYGAAQGSWPIATPSVSPAALLGPGLLLLGVNLGALLYMLLGLLGLAPPSPAAPQRYGGIYRNDRHDLDVGKETDMYF
ncbi:hypothetical protein KR222_001748 [Zaprionus bogoriensis]|nr:hypothetical protein KR222_001748 [Zaprionus bogoriensis]